MILFKIYLLIIVLIITHELAHYLFLKIFRVKIHKVVIGSFLYYKYKKLEIAPFIFSGHVLYDENKFNKLYLYQKALILLCGIIVNVLVYFLIPDTMYIFKNLTLLYIILSVLPLSFFNTDTYILFKIVFLSINKMIVKQ